MVYVFSERSLRSGIVLCVTRMHLTLGPLDHTVCGHARTFHYKSLQDGFSHPIYSSAVPTSRVLLQVKRTKAADGQYVFQVSAVARIPTTHEFSGLADFQVLFVAVFASACH
jgi:hypothetical protein